MIVLMCTNGFPANIFASYLPFLKELGYSGTQTSSLVTIRCLSAFTGMTLVPLFYRRINLRIGLALSCLILAVAYFIHSFARSYAGYIAGAACMGLAHGFGGMIPISLLMRNWFRQKRASAISISTVGMGIGSIILPPLVVRVAQGVSLPAAFRMTSYIALAIMVLAFLIIRDTPDERGLTPFGYEKATGEQDSAVAAEGRDIPRVPRYCMLFGLLLLGGVAMSAAGHFPTLFTSVGYSKEEAALSFSLLGISLTVSKLIFGPLVDRFGNRKASLLFLVLLTLGAVSCALCPLHPICMYAGTLLMGLGFSPATVGISLFAADFSAAKNYPSLLKDFQRAFTAGGILFTSVPGKLFDLFGSYVISYWMFAGMVVAFTIILLLVYRITEVKCA